MFPRVVKEKEIEGTRKGGGGGKKKVLEVFQDGKKVERSPVRGESMGPGAEAAGVAPNKKTIKNKCIFARNKSKYRNIYIYIVNIGNYRIATQRSPPLWTKVSL